MNQARKKKLFSENYKDTYICTLYIIYMSRFLDSDINTRFLEYHLNNARVFFTIIRRS